MTTGGEVGVYNTKGPGLNIPGIFDGTFYYCVDDDDLRSMSITLKKLGKTLFKRTRPHWWLTGFKLGEFSEPSELTMNIFITLKNEIMRNAFIGGLIEAGYSKDELIISGNSVGVLFDKPRNRQPITRTELTDGITQRKNKLRCDKFNLLTKDYDNSWDKINAIQESAPEMLMDVLNIGKTKKYLRCSIQFKNI
ncbi:uncharacterized protein DUF4474 [Serpentinicella alkaliphila]|uniref:Uncharacterized protein DUF4474 n=1 Tax=Serpentinicella alkaliphila TaxID=1734049 RepID=A0A4R2TFS2_9FIRM|nr:uncharacterized protein DUF4474 [Serpentinicella alkaliphila]